MTKKRDLVSSLACLLVGIGFCAGAIGYGLIRRGAPGPGFFPFLAALGFILLTFILFVTRVLEKKGEGMALPFFPEKASWKRLSLVIGSLAFYAVALDRLGFPLTTFLFMSVLLRIEPKKWTMILVTSILATGFSYLLFEVLLKVQLPKGVLGV